MTTNDVKLPVANSTIAGALCGAFEGGSNYWYQIDDYRDDPQAQRDPSTKGWLMVDGVGWPWYIALPVLNGALTISDIEDGGGEREHWVLDRGAIEKGLVTMHEKYPKHYADMISESGDATTGDVFLQCCLFGEIVFG